MIDIADFSTMQTFYLYENQYTYENKPWKDKTTVMLKSHDISGYLLSVHKDDKEYYYDCPNGDRLYFTYISYTYNEVLLKQNHGLLLYTIKRYTDIC